MGTETSSPANIDLKFLPRVLTENCQRLVESYHAIHGYASLPDILWRAEARDFVEMNADLRRIYRKASITRSARKANTSYVMIASALLSLEILATDFLGWGTRYPWAKRKAASLLQAHLPATRAQLRDVYLRQQNYVRTQVISTAISPPPDLAAARNGAVASSGPQAEDEQKAVVMGGGSRESFSRRQGAV
jgi:hypothetical protein